MRYPRPFRGRGGMWRGTNRSRLAPPECSLVRNPMSGTLRSRHLRGGVSMPRDRHRKHSHGRRPLSPPRTAHRDCLHDGFQSPGSERSHWGPDPIAVTRDRRAQYYRHFPETSRPVESFDCNPRAKSNKLQRSYDAAPLLGFSRGGRSCNGPGRQRSPRIEYPRGSTSRPRCSGNRPLYYGRQRIIKTRPTHRRSSRSRSKGSSRRSPTNFVQPLEEWRTTNPADIIKRLNKSSCTAVEKLLADGEVDKTTEILVGSCGKACGHDRGSERIRDVLKLLHRKRFLDLNLNPWIAQKKCYNPGNANEAEIFECLVMLLRGMSQEVPESIGSVEVSLIVMKRTFQDFERGDPKISPVVESALKGLLTQPNENRQAISCENDGVPQEEPPDDFRQMSILPTSEDLKNDHKPFLRTNIVNGCYENVHHYLDVHFRLLREDFVQPLREGIAEYVTTINQKGNSENTRFQNLRLYDDVRAIDISPSQDGFVYILQFAVTNHMKRVRWEQSKRLIYGSLVCLSRDDFKTFIFGYVANSDIRELVKGRVAVTFNVSDEESKDLFSFSFKMAESSSYFEAYRHILKSLQTIDQENFPFKRYLISVSKDVNPPKYIMENPDQKFTLCCDHIGQYKIDSEQTSQPSETWHPVEVIKKQIQISIEENWPSADELGFDDSQMEAYKAALRQEICLIQGPPGTGKTYVGLKIVQTLLDNHVQWGKKPLLVVCCTNHALDQFLEGILQKCRSNVVRIGNRSSSEKIQKLNLNRLTREKSRKNQFLRRQYSAMRDNLRKCAENVERCKHFIATARKKILDYHLLLPGMSALHLQNLTEYMQRHPGIDVLLIWLNIVDEYGCLNDRPLRLPFEQKGKFDHWYHNPHYLNEKEDDGTYSFDYCDDEFDRRRLDDDDELIQEVFDYHYTAENIAAEIPENYINQHMELTHRQQIEEVIESTVMELDIMTPEESHTITDIYSLEIRQRWRLYRLWVKSFIEGKQRQLREETEQFRVQKERFDAFRLEEQVKALQGISVIGVTTTGAAKYQQLIRQIGPRIVLVEEAAEIFEAHVTASLTSDCQHLILIGDHQQLRPNPTVYELCKNYKLDVSLFERLIKNGMPYHRLSWQHRMRPEISYILKVHENFYPDLSDHQSVKSYEGIEGIEKDVFFVDHDFAEDGNDESKTHSNLHEAAFLTSLCKYLIQQGYTSKQITILTAYRGQMWNIRDLTERRGLKEVRVCPIDNFQGEENDIILVSFVRSNEEGSIGFLKVPNRICVALSRARKGLYCVGNFTLMSKCSDLWKVIINDLQKRGCIGRKLKLLCRNHPNTFTEVSHVDDFANVPDGGCSEPCNARLNCGHTCQRKCHPEDRKHLKVRCMKPCNKKCSAGMHKCRRFCYEKCKEPCRESTKKILPCSHVQLADCYLSSEEVKCLSKCDKKLPCDHQCQRLCHEKCTEKCPEKITKIFTPCGHQLEVSCFQTECTQACNTELKCGHVCSATCGQCRNGRFHVKCEEKCKRTLVCGHVCESKCSSTCPPCKKQCQNRCYHNECMKPCGEICIPCAESCFWRCRHLRCNTKCGETCDREPCNRSCRKKLNCGHSCIGLCGEPCPQLCRKCNKNEVTEILFGNEDERGAKFIFLQECRHIVEVNAMDNFMKTCDSSDQEIKLPECPWCKTPIRFNSRYNNKIKAIRNDVERVKKTILDQGEAFHAKLRKLKERTSEGMTFGYSSYLLSLRLTFHAYKGGEGLDFQTISNASNSLNRNVRKNINDPTLLTLRHLSKVEVQLDMFEKLRELIKLRMSGFDGIGSTSSETNEQLKRFDDDFRFILQKTISFTFVTEQEIEDWQREYKRCRHILTLLNIQKAFRQPQVKLENLKTETKMLEEVENLLFDGERFSEEKETKVRDTLKELKTVNPLLASIGITESERDMVVQAMGFTRGHWFKCPNGHVYAIGECGGAMQRSRCPECKASIGGESHRLDEGNVVASEMDGALHPAYSEEANNMMNFEELV